MRLFNKDVTAKRRNAMRSIVIIVCIVVFLCLGMFAVAHWATNAPTRIVREYNLPLGGGHRITFMLIPCSATDGGYLSAGYDIFRSSWINGPPMVALPTAPTCP